MAKIKTSGAGSGTEGLFYAGFAGLFVLLFYPPFFRGLFFPKEQQWALIFAAVLFAIVWFWKLSRREVSFLNKPLDYLVLAIVLAYGISVFGAANTRLALGEVIKYGLYFLVFWLSSQVVQSKKHVKVLLHAIYIAGVLVALAGIMCASGMIEIKDGFLNGRIYSTMQYPNALASYLAALSFIGMYLWLNAGKFGQASGFRGQVTGVGGASSGFGKEVLGNREKASLIQFLYAIGNYILLLIYIGTGSRGGLIVYPVVLFIYFVGLNRECRGWVFGHFVLTLAAALVANIKLMPMLVAGNAGTAWLWFFIGLGIALVGQLVISFLPLFRINRRVLIGAALVLIVMVIFGAVQVKSPEVSSKLVPGQLISSIRNINLADRNVQERFVFWQDAFKIVKEHPVFGFGGGVFEETFRRYQSYFYSSTQVHNHYMQMWAEAGTVGLLIFFAIWAFYKLTVWKLWWKKQDRELRLLVWSMFGTAAMLGLHAFLDFDLSLSAITMVMFAMFGLTRGVERFTGSEYRFMEYNKFSQVRWFYQAGAVVLALAVIIPVSLLNMGMAEAKQGTKAFQENKLPQAREYFEKSLSHDPFNAEVRINLAETYQALDEKEKALAQVETAVAAVPYNLKVLGGAINVCGYVGEITKVLDYSQRLVENFPFGIPAWEGMTYRYFVVGYQAWVTGYQPGAREMMAKTMEIPARIKNQMAGVTDQYKSMWGTQMPLLDVTPAVNLYSGAAAYVLNDWTTAETSLRAAFDGLEEDPELRGEAAMWLTTLYAKQGKTAEAEAVAKEGDKLMKDFRKHVQGLKSLDILK